LDWHLRRCKTFHRDIVRNWREFVLNQNPCLEWQRLLEQEVSARTERSTTLWLVRKLWGISKGIGGAAAKTRSYSWSRW
jgi:hypothetical protein